MTRKVQKANEYIKRTYWLRTAIGTVLAFCLLAFLQFPAKALYYGTFNGEWFLNVRSVAVTFTDENGHTSTNIPADQPGDILLVRSPRDRITAYNVVRTFYLKAGDRAVLQRDLPDGIEYEQNISQNIIPLLPTQRPNEPGEYHFCQSVTFKIYQDIEKHATFCSTPYRIIPATPEE